ncbi:MAG: hypothetical protein HQK56_11620 [Deltaproteobacteria bacterium]|nr:hypothetical protein [Deltaproteobacteria bacterium]
MTVVSRCKSGATVVHSSALGYSPASEQMSRQSGRVKDIVAGLVNLIGVKIEKPEN